MGSRKQGFQCYCRNCRKIGYKESEGKKRPYVRKTLTRHPDDYSRPPKCDKCGESDWAVSNYRTSGKEVEVKKKNGKQCTCDGLPHVHQTGAKIGDYQCNHYEDWKLEQSIKQDVDSDNPGDFGGEAPF